MFLSCNTWSTFPGKTVCRPAAKALKRVCCGIRKRRDQTTAAQQRRIAGKAETKNVITGRCRREETAHQREWPCQGKAAEFMALLFISLGSQRTLLGGKKNRKGNKKEFKIILMAWGQIHSRPELCLGISPLFLTFPDVFPWNDGWEAGEHHVYGVPLYILSCAPATLPAHKIYPAALSKCPNHPPLSQFLTHFPEMWAALSPASHWHTMATFACPETTLWPNCGVFVQQRQCTLEACCNFWPEVQSMRRLGVCKEPREGE